MRNHILDIYNRRMKITSIQGCSFFKGYEIVIQNSAAMKKFIQHFSKCEFLAMEPIATNLELK